MFGLARRVEDVVAPGGTGLTAQGRGHATSARLQTQPLAASASLGIQFVLGRGGQRSQAAGPRLPSLRNLQGKPAPAILEWTCPCNAFSSRLPPPVESPGIQVPSNDSETGLPPGSFTPESRVLGDANEPRSPPRCCQLQQHPVTSGEVDAADVASAEFSRRHSQALAGRTEAESCCANGRTGSRSHARRCRRRQCPGLPHFKAACPRTSTHHLAPALFGSKSEMLLAAASISRSVREF